MAYEISWGSKVTETDLGLSYRQHRMGVCFDGYNFKDNFVFNSLEQVFSHAMKTACKRSEYGCSDFFPVIQGRVNGQDVGVIGLIRFHAGNFEFAYFGTGVSDVDQYNQRVKEDQHYPYSHNLTAVEYSGDSVEGAAFAKALLTFLNAFSRFKISDLTSTV